MKKKQPQSKNTLKNGLITEGDVVEIHDGDTIWVEIRRRFPIRITDTDKLPLKFNCPELNTPEGVKALNRVKELLTNKKVQVFIPAGNELNLMDINSFNRIVAEIYIDGVKLTDILIAEGLAEFRSYG